MAKFIKPSWLTKSFIKNALCGNGWKIRKDGNWEKCTESNILSIEDLNVNMPVPKGNNFACTIYRANVACKLKDESLKNISLIVKEPLEVDEIKSRSKAGIFQKESIIYDELLPKFQSTFGEKWGEMTPKLFHMNDDHILVLEDLKESGYVMLDRTKLLNFEEGEIALSALAKFHAASAKIYETESELIKKAAREIMFQPDRKDTTMIYWNSFFEGAVDSCLKRPDLIKYAQPLRKFSNNLWDTAQRELKPNKNEFNVLNHGDPWATNMMFKYIHNKPVHVKIIDFQVSRYGSPAFDLIQFMYGTIQEGVRLEKYEQLLKIYLEKLNNALISFGSNERLDKLDLEKAIEKRTFYAVFITITSLPMSIADPAKAEIISKEKNGVRIKSYFENKKYLDIMSKRLEEFETKGWI